MIDNDFPKDIDEEWGSDDKSTQNFETSDLPLEKTDKSETKSTGSYGTKDNAELYRSSEEDDDEAGFDDEESEDEEEDEEDGDDDSQKQLTGDDALGPAFDLENGRPLYEEEEEEEGNYRRRAPLRAKIETPKDFFSAEILYRFDILEDEERDQLVGSYCIDLRGSNGGFWTVKVGQEMDVVAEKESADVEFLIQQNDFINLVNGKINPQLALLAKKVKISGDAKKAFVFNELIFTGRS